MALVILYLLEYNPYKEPTPDSYLLIFVGISGCWYFIISKLVFKYFISREIDKTSRYIFGGFLVGAFGGATGILVARACDIISNFVDSKFILSVSFYLYFMGLASFWLFLPVMLVSMLIGREVSYYRRKKLNATSPPPVEVEKLDLTR